MACGQSYKTAPAVKCLQRDHQKLKASFFINVGEKVIQRILMHLCRSHLFQLYPDNIALNLIILNAVVVRGNK